ncbi:Maltose acetyltransferase [Ceratobasidium sp. 394]|nr:Maltose acetyltransferase [Ceratobasidium sp. 394]
MSMYLRISNRSTGGCLTCKQRKKKCDETRPKCLRCHNGDFHCLGYGNSNVPDAANQAQNRPTDSLASLFSSALAHPDSNPQFGPSQELSQNNLILLSRQPRSADHNDYIRSIGRLNYVPRGVQPDPFALDSMVALIVSQYIKLSSRVMFRPFRVISEPDLTNHITNRISNVKRWSWYLGATITHALFEGYQLHRHISLIDRFTRRITASEESNSWSLDTPGLGDKLSCLEDLVHYVLMTSSGTAAYSLMRLCTPVFLQLAAKIEQIWTPTSAISIGHALHGPMHEMRKFVFWDTMAAVAFGSTPLLHYDAALHPSPHIGGGSMILEWVYGCPAELVVLFAKVNGWRVARWMESPATGAERVDEWKEVEKGAKTWSAMIDRTDESAGAIARLAVQESMRQAILIYLYMVMCGADSSDPRVESAVRQVVQLAGTIESGNPLEIHLFMPCLIAGVAARKEQHRSLLCRKLEISRNERVWCLRGADFVPVLEHLWHGAGASGCPVTWEDYVNSRCVVLPLDQ